MALKTLLKFILQNPMRLLYRINKTTTECYRAGFIATAVSEGLYDALSGGPLDLADLQRAIGSGPNAEGLRAWLDLGVALGELGKNGNTYSLKSAFSKALMKPANDAWKAFFQSRVDIFYN